MQIIKNYLFKLIRIDPYRRKILMVFLDFFIIPFSIYLTFFLNNSQFYINKSFYYILLISVFILIPFYIFTGQYKGLTRYIASTYIYKIVIRNLILTPIIMIFYRSFNLPDLGIKFWLIFFFFLTSSSGFIRIFIRDIILNLKKSEKKSNIVVYGAGEGGALLSKSLKNDPNYSIQFFIDDNSELWGRSINNIPIHSPKILNLFQNKIDQIFLAIPSLPNKKKENIFSYLSQFNIPLSEIPTIKELTNNRLNINSLRPINLEDLLGRKKINLEFDKQFSAFESLSICITGAGGSIGAELCKQILSLKPSKIILLEHNEPSLYFINQKLQELNQSRKVVVLPILGNCCDRSLVREIFNKHKIKIVFHAAAYKHVPLVEMNPIQGISNNIFSTKIICEEARSANVNKVIFISTDKAVRPTNVMGASKRLAEMIVLASGEENNKKIKTTFSIVRFGNVLGSSGSVVPLFMEQIKSGGPLTLTSPDVTRYFMSIKEAVQLVIQTSNLSKNKDIFLLEMGKPVRILDLAKQMISLSGLTIKDKKNPNGDIEIIFTGLRPGEKLYEELLIDDKSEKTENPLIFRTIEKSLNSQELFPKVEELEKSLSNNNYWETLILLKELVPEWEIEENKKKAIPKKFNKI